MNTKGNAVSYYKDNSLVKANAVSYYKERELKNAEKIENLLSSLPDFVRRYIHSIQNSATTLTQIGYLTDITGFFGYIENRPDMVTIEQIENLRRDDIYDYLGYMRGYRNENGQIITNEEASLKRKLASLRGLWAYLYDEDLISQNIMTKVRIPKVRKKDTIRLDNDEKSELFDFVENGHEASARKEIYHQKLKVRDLAIISVFMSTGMRVSELVGLNRKDIDLNKASVRITRKGNKADLVYMSDEAVSYLSDYLDERNKIDTGGDELFLSSQKRRISARIVEVLVKNYASRVTLKHITPHKLRSTYGSELYEATGDIYLVAKALGHNSTDTTTRHYISTSDKKKEEARNKIRLKGE